MLRTYVAGMLGESPHVIKTACDGREAIEYLSKEDFDLVLMDIQMPNMDGFEASRIIRDHGSQVRNHAVPIIATTASAMKGDKERCLESGMNDYIAKPFTVAELFEKISHVLPSRANKKETDIIDQTRLRKLYGSNDVLRRKVFGEFRRNVAVGRMDEMRKALDAGDSVLIGRQAHSLKGAAGTIGAKSLEDTALLVELAAKIGNIEETRIHFGKLEYEFNRLMVYLQGEEE